MAWDEVSAIGSIAAAVILLIGSAAAVIQLKHLRLANQIDCYLELMRLLNSPELVDAREYVESHDYENPDVLRQAFESGLDHRVMMIGGFYQTATRLINLNVLDQELFTPIIFTAPRVWKALRPIAYELRKRSPENLRWLDLEYVVYQKPNWSWTKRYSRDFRDRVGIDAYVAERLRRSAEERGR